jgi:hypothetical protein
LTDFSKKKDPNADKPKFEKLYNLRKRQIDKTEKSSEDYYFEKNKEELTFKPQLNKTNPSMLTKPVPTKHRNRAEEKQLERMRLARE